MKIAVTIISIVLLFWTALSFAGNTSRAFELTCKLRDGDSQKNKSFVGIPSTIEGVDVLKIDQAKAGKFALNAAADASLGFINYVEIVDTETGISIGSDGESKEEYSNKINIVVKSKNKEVIAAATCSVDTAK